MDPALQALLDRQAIDDLVNAYCNASDRHDHEKMRALYHEDAVDDHGGFYKGLAMEFIDKLPEIQAPMRILHHNITTRNIKLDGNYAEGELYVLAFHQVETEDGLLDLMIGGRYFDKYEKRGASGSSRSRCPSSTRRGSACPRRANGSHRPGRARASAA